tara:strand:- start:325 stop:927 length:603 start_codon:yes stop_codon:yes gene_type:complete
MKIILASKSPRRKEILEKININFKVMPSNFDENQIIFNNNPIEFCQILAHEKAKNVAMKNENYFIIGADTIVVEKNQIFPKPRNEEEALKFLQYLSNKTHQVYTGISFIFNGESLNFYEKTDVTFRNISLTDIKFYIKNHNPYDKSGGYGIQDYSSIFISKINGCFFNVVGFPLSKFYNKFRFFLKKIPENCLVKNSEKL